MPKPSRSRRSEPARATKSAARVETANRSKRRPRLNAELTTAINAARDKKATDLTVLDLRKTGAFTDYFLICTGANPRQVHAIADGIEAALKAKNVRPAHVEGYQRAEWVLVDYFDFVVHVFSPSARAFYGLERLWGNAERIDVPA